MEAVAPADRKPLDGRARSGGLVVERSDVGWTPVRKMIKAEAALERARARVRSCGRAGEKARRITREQGGRNGRLPFGMTGV